MKLIQLHVPPDRESAFDALDERDVDYVRFDADDREGTVVHFPLPGEGVDEVLGDLDVDSYTVVADADRVTSDHFEELRERYAETEQDESVTAEQLRDRAEELNPSWLTFLGTALLSAVVVAAGLLRNSAAAVAGAMVIAPYFGTALSVSVGLVSADRYLFANGIKHQVVGLLASVGSAAVVGVAARRLGFVPVDLLVTDIGQVSIFLTPTPLSLTIAVAAGAAGALTFATAADVTLSGVAIAAAIVPSAGTVGLGLAWHDPAMVAGAATLLAMNVVCINAAAVVVLVALGYTPGVFEFERSRRRSRARVAAAVVAGAVLLAVAAGGVVAAAEHARYDRRVTRAVGETVADPAYGAASVASVRVGYDGPSLLPSSRRVVVTVVAERRHEGLAGDIRRRVEERTGEPVDVRVRYRTYGAPAERSSNGRSGSWSTASTTASSTAATFSPSVTLM
ncbi:MAG: DUF389 domain-containing protein [Halobacteriaceae archaeon]